MRLIKHIQQLSYPQLPQNNNMIHTIHKNHIITLMNDNTKTNDYFKILENSNIQIGISQSFDNLLLLIDYYKQALYTAIYSHQKIDNFDHVYPNVIYSSMDVDHVQVFILPILFTIQEYDKDNETKYFETLKAYCLSAFNKEKTAKTLYIHRNTLLYRLNRISELFDINIQDEHILIQLLNSFQIYDVYMNNQ